MKLLKVLIKNHKMLFNLIKSDFKNRYLGNHLGIMWAFIQPCVMVAVYWFVFTRGFRAGSVSNVPFLLWLLAGMVPWFLTNDAIMSASNAIVSQGFLVKKILFEVKLLPFVKIGSAILANLAFWFFLLIVCFVYGYHPNWWWLQLAYYMLCVIAISMSFGLLFSAITPFMPDISQIINLIFQVLFWATPVMWDKNILNGKLVYLIKLNPFAYIVDGFRDTLINQQPFWHHYSMTIYFWLLNFIVYWLANRIFNNLRPHFADVL